MAFLTTPWDPSGESPDSSQSPLYCVFDGMKLGNCRVTGCSPRYTRSLHGSSCTASIYVEPRRGASMESPGGFFEQSFEMCQTDLGLDSPFFSTSVLKTSCFPGVFDGFLK